MFLLLLSQFLIGISTPIASHLIDEQDPLIFAYHFLLILSLMQLPLILSRLGEIRTLFQRGHFGVLFMTGVIGTFLYWCEFSALKVGLSIAQLSFLSLTIPAWVMLYEYLMKEGDQSHLHKWLMAMVGSAVLILPIGGEGFSLGHLLPILASLLYAAFIVSAKRSQDDGVSPIVCSFFNDLLPLLGIASLILIRGQPQDLLVMPQSPVTMFLYVAFIGLLPGIIFLYGLKKTELTTASFVVILEPILLGVIAIIYSEGQLTLNVLVGALMIAVANMPDFFFSSLRKVRADYAAFLLIK